MAYSISSKHSRAYLSDNSTDNHPLFSSTPDREAANYWETWFITYESLLDRLQPNTDRNGQNSCVNSVRRKTRPIGYQPN